MTWKRTPYKGVRYREHQTRMHGRQKDRYFNIRYRVSGINVDESFGWASEGWSAKKAFLLMAELKEELRTGKGSGRLADRRRAKQEELETRCKAPTVSDLWDAYQKKLAPKGKNKEKRKADSTMEGELRHWRNTIEPELGHMKAEDVKPMHISKLLEKKAETAPVSANRLYSLLSVMFRVAMEKGWTTTNPLYLLGKPGGSESPRRRILSDSEIEILWPYFDQLRPNPRDILKLGLLTAQRSGEIMAMRWADVDMEAATWTQQTNKTNTVHLVPLSAQVLDILSARERKGPWVFPSAYNKEKGAVTGHAKTTKDARWKIQKLSGIKGWTNHDLRRTARTIMSRLAIRHHVRERVLNHSQGGIVEVYDQHDYLQEKRDALNKLAREIYRIIGQATKAEIIELKTVNIR